MWSDIVGKRSASLPLMGTSFTRNAIARWSGDYTQSPFLSSIWTKLLSRPYGKMSCKRLPMWSYIVGKKSASLSLMGISITRNAIAQWSGDFRRSPFLSFGVRMPFTHSVMPEVSSIAMAMQFQAQTVYILAVSMSHVSWLAVAYFKPQVIYSRNPTVEGLA